MTNNNNHTDISKIHNQPLLPLVSQAYNVHTANFNSDIELCHLTSVKTGGCPEDCGYCSQSNKHNTDIKVNPLLPIEEIEKQAEMVKKHGVTRMCLAAGYKTPNTAALDKACEYVKVIKKHGLETCVTFGSLDINQAQKLKDAGLDYYNHNIDTSPEYYAKVVTTRSFQDRVDTINNVGSIGIKVCCGGILGLGESRDDRISFIKALTDLPYTPDSIPINMLVKIPGTRLADVPDLDKIELVRVIATIRILFPKSKVRLTAGRSELSELEQALCFMAGANSIFVSDKLLTTPNTNLAESTILLSKLGINQ
jgi:biotin synthase